MLQDFLCRLLYRPNVIIVVRLVRDAIHFWYLSSTSESLDQDYVPTRAGGPSYPRAAIHTLCLQLCVSSSHRATRCFGSTHLLPGK
jgi:hypothetical protein